MTQLDELMKKIEAMEAEITRLKVAPPAAKAEAPTEVTRADHPGDGGGWVVLTPVPTYSGALFGIQFQDGRAIVDVEINNAPLIVTRMESDFGYEVHPLGADDLNAFRKDMAKAGRSKDTRSLGEKLAQPMRV